MPLCITETVEVTIRRYDEVDADFALRRARATGRCKIGVMPIALLLYIECHRQGVQSGDAAGLRNVSVWSTEQLRCRIIGLSAWRMHKRINLNFEFKQFFVQ